MPDSPADPIPNVRLSALSAPVRLEQLHVSLVQVDLYVDADHLDDLRDRDHDVLAAQARTGDDQLAGPALVVGHHLDHLADLLLAGPDRAAGGDLVGALAGDEIGVDRRPVGGVAE